MESDSNYLMLNGEAVPVDEAAISPVMNGLYHGTGAFETFLSDAGSIFRFKEHLERLNAGLKFLGFEKDSFMRAESLRKDVDQLLKLNGMDQKKARVRIQVSEAGSGGYESGKPMESVCIITADELAQRASQSVRLVTSPVCVVPSECRPAKFKLSNMLHYRDAMRRARSAGADDALMCTTQGAVAESAIANLFWLKNHIIYTPSEDCDILPGIMRGALIDLLEKSLSDQFQIRQGKYSPADLSDADCIWLTNSVRGLLPVAALDEKPFKTDHPAFILVREKMQHYVRTNSE
jgi:branched-subunit amino acid aminotransferase/4-amino-4-deoxychorismate lyase